MTTLPEGLLWIVWGGGAGLVAAGLIELLKSWPAFGAWWDRLADELARYIAFAISGVFGILGFLIQVSLGYEPPPGDLTAWLEVLFSIVIAQLAYAGYKLVRRGLRRA